MRHVSRRLRATTRFAALLVCCSPLANGVEQSVTTLQCGNVIDPGGAPPTSSSRTLVIEQGRIARVLDGFVDVPGATRIDLREAHCLPGLIDTHTHLTFESSGAADLVHQVSRTPAERALIATRYACATAMAGFTTVRDLGSTDALDVALKHAIDAGYVVGPRMFVAAMHLSMTGGHGDITNGLREDLAGLPDEAQGVIDGPVSAIRATRLAIKRGADVIKVMASGGVLSIGDSGSLPQLSLDEIRAVVTEAKDHGLKVAAHTHSDIGAQRAIEAGVASIEHGTYLSARTYELMKRKHVFLVPTVIAGVRVAQRAQDASFYPPAVTQKALTIAPQLQHALRRAHSAGVPIAFGTDAGVFPHGQNAEEFVYMVAAGMSAMEAIRAATDSAAQLLGKSHELGGLRPGYIADVIAVAANPLDDVRALQSVHFVMKQGRVLKNAGVTACQ